MLNNDVAVKDVYKAKQNISYLVDKTPLRRSFDVSKFDESSVSFKLESLQPTGSFKIRGVTNKLSLLNEEERKGVITISSGNHGQALSYVANHLGIPAVVYVSKQTPKNKIDKIRYFGADVKVEGDIYEEAENKARELCKEKGLTWIDPFDDPVVIAGQGTVGLELLEDNPGIDTVVVPVGGGGLISGIGMVMKYSNPEIKVIGVQMKRDPVMYDSLKAGYIAELEGQKETLADGLAGALPLDNEYTFRMCQEFVDEVVLVSEEQIARAIRFAFNKHRLVVEGAGAVGIAALLAGKVECAGKNVAVVVSGSNIDLPLFQEIIENHQQT